MTYKIVTEEQDLQKVFEIRKEIFVKEQEVSEDEEFDAFDSLDADCNHILVYYDNKPVGTGRVRAVEEVGKLERICILKPYRKYGLGKVIVQSLEEIVLQKRLTRAKLHGQTHAEGFYHKLGYETVSDEFLEDGIPHYLMVKQFN
ncbi:GNAT family N-acetyltransferase [Oceanobacillus oncorhynchi]|uniref:GNAT family N-acetyltransferase n=1 Tax=Oceanobacillus oncorhynchi TaxID=545501 RepID=UPI002116D520|nr:GNAT family N-acetyltransferase [Oceanobacillus oncorhynchi]MDM8100261.1 GNAT family N-acetyltransferase [Oceanobacillus oncorhynchi]UUI40924.1 GNAT family N-acetyltransferase [Oceanobacillus oncorhynchi]